MTPNPIPLHFRRLTLLALSGFLIVCFFIPVGSRAYTDPVTIPPNYDSNLVPDLLSGEGATTGPSVQRIGSLLIGQADTLACPTGNEPGCNNQRKLCLNPLLSNYDGVHSTFYPGTTDVSNPSISYAGNCITSWAELQGWQYGPLYEWDIMTLRRSTPYPYTPNEKDYGYSTWRANKDGQLFSLISEIQIPSGPVGATSPTAVRTDAYTQTQYAAQFFGTLGVGSDNFPGRLCLNDQTQAGGKNGNCKSSWDEVTTATQTGLVLLQNMQSTSLIAPNIGQTSTAGLLVVGNFVAGSPIGTGTCGDGICLPPSETNASCLVDCPVPPNRQYSCGDGICQPPSETNVTCSWDCQ